MVNTTDDSTSHRSTSNKSIKFRFVDDQDEDMHSIVGKSELVLKSKNDEVTDTSDTSCTKSCDTIHEGNDNSTSIDLDTQLAFLIEIAGITLPPNKSSAHKWMMDLGETSTLNPRGMHCTATWVDKPKTVAGTAREETLHRTKTMRIIGGKEVTVTDPDLTVSTSESSDDTHVSAEEERRNSEHILTVDDSSLFLFDTSMKQLLHAQTHSSDEDNRSAQEQLLTKIKSCGGIRFDIFEKPIDALSSIYRYVSQISLSKFPISFFSFCFNHFSRSVLAESTREKEDNATDASFSYSSKKLYLANYNASYRLIGSVFLTPEDIVSSCNSERFESNLCSGLRKEHRSQKKSLDRRSTFSPENGGKLALRIRKASEFDKVFIRTLRHCDVNNVRMTIDMLNDAVRENDPTRPHLEPVTITTEYDEKEVGVQASLKAIGDLSPQAFESVSDVKSGFLVRH